MVRKKFVFIEGWASIGINTVLFVLKFWVGMVTGSVAITADAWHTLSDSLTSLIVIGGTVIAGKAADKDHPFGHGRAEFIASIIISVLLAVVGFEFLIESIKKLFEKNIVDYGTISFIVFGISAFVKEGLARYSFWAAKKTGAMSLKADGWHHRSDAIASLIILVGIFLSSYFWWIDSVLGILVSLFIFVTAMEIIRESTKPLLGQDIDEELKKKILLFISARSSEVEDVHHFHIHNYGNHQELSFHLRLDKHKSVEEAQQITQRIEDGIRKKFNLESTIHVDALE